MPLALALVAGGVVAVGYAARGRRRRRRPLQRDGVRRHHAQPSSTTWSAAPSAGAAGRRSGGEYLVVWAGDRNAADTKGSDLQRDAAGPQPGEGRPRSTPPTSRPAPTSSRSSTPTETSPTYGKVVNTVTVGPLVENEPHHLQYVWHKGHRIFAGGLFTDTTYVFDVDEAARR